MAGRQDGQARSIHDAQAGNTSDPGIGIEHGHLVIRRTHLTGAGGVEDGGEALLDVAPDLVVGLVVAAGKVLVADEQRAHRRRFPHFTRALEGGDSDLLVGRVAKPVRVDDGRVRCVVGLDRHVARRQCSHQASDYRRVLEPVGGLDKLEVGRVAEEAAVGEVLDLRPVRRKGRVQRRNGGVGEVVARETFPACSVVSSHSLQDTS